MRFRLWLKRLSGEQRGVLLGLGACLLLLLLVLPARLDVSSAEEEAPPSPPPASLPDASLPSDSTSLPDTAAPEPPTSSLPDASSAAPPSSSSEEEPPPAPQYSFTAQETARLDALLYDWSQQATVVTLQETDAAGDPIGPPVVDDTGGHRVAAWFWDIDSGASYEYNAISLFYYASVIKAPYVAWLYRLADDGACDLGEYLTVTWADVAANMEYSGKIKEEEEFPRSYTVGQLLDALILDSDTLAFQVLLRRFPAEDFAGYAQALGVDTSALGNALYGFLSAADLGKLLADLYDYTQNGQYGAVLLDNLAHTRNAMVLSVHPVAQKYGWDRYAYHSIAIVQAPHPYLLVVLTDKWGAENVDRSGFTALPALLEGMMEEKYSQMQ